jgi:uncharacterized LabA/DUF88 family protein
MALFCDFENVALGVRDAKFEKFDIKLVLERLLLKGSIVVKKAYCDWERYKGFKSAMHEANFELIEIPHVRQSGKNSADIRLVVDALDLCYTKSHVNTFVIISGDSDFSPLVSKLRENAKQVIGVGVKQSTSDLLIANCDEFIFYDDLARESQRAVSKRETRGAEATSKRSPDEEKRRKEERDARRTEAIEMAVQTFDALVTERGDSGKVWASALKDAIKRRKPDFSESYYGFRAFGNLLEEAQSRGLLEVGRDEKSGTYVYRGIGVAVRGEQRGESRVESRSEQRAESRGEQRGESRGEQRGEQHKESRGESGSKRQRASRRGESKQSAPEPAMLEPAAFEPDAPSPTAPEAVAEPVATPESGTARRKGRGGRQTSEKKAKTATPEMAEASAPAEAQSPVETVQPEPQEYPEEAGQPVAKKAAKTARKTSTRTRRPRKTAATPENA